MRRELRAFSASTRLWLRYMVVDRFMLFCAFVQPFFIAVTVMYMLHHQPQFDPVYVVVGSALTGIWSVVLFDGSWAINSERFQGTLELLVGAPSSLYAVIAGKLAGGMAFSVTSMALSYAVGAWLFGYSIVVRDVPAFALAFALTLIAIGALGVLIAPLGILARSVRQFLTVLEHPIYILGGFLFPVLLLPGWLLPISYALPPYWAAVALHGTSSGELAGVAFAQVCAVLLLSSLACFVLAAPLFRLVLRRARVEGTLSLT